MDEPIELRPNSLMGVKMGLSIQLLSGGVAEPGRLLEGPYGRRLFYGQIGNDCIFIGADMSPGAIGRLGRIYSQGRGSFSNDISLGGPAKILSAGLAGTKAVISNFLDVFVGAVACAGGSVAWGITGMTLAVNAGKIKKEYKTYSAGLDAIYCYTAYCSALTPTLTKHLLGPLIFDAIWDNAKAKRMGKITDAVPASTGCRMLYSPRCSGTPWCGSSRYEIEDGLPCVSRGRDGGVVTAAPSRTARRLVSVRICSQSGVVPPAPARRCGPPHRGRHWALDGRRTGPGGVSDPVGIRSAVRLIHSQIQSSL